MSDPNKLYIELKSIFQGFISINKLLIPINSLLGWTNFGGLWVDKTLKAEKTNPRLL